MFKQVLTAHDIKVAFDLRVFLGEAVNFFLGEVAAKASVEFAWKLWKC
jgi:hypothetical protein